MALRKPLFMNSTEGFSEELSLTAGDALNVSSIVIPLSGSGGIGIDLGHNAITNLATPSLPDDAANKAYVDAVATGLDPHSSCRAKTDHKLGSQGRRVGSGGTWTGALNTGDKFTVAIDGETPVLITLASAPIDLAAAILAVNTLYTAGGGTGGTVAYLGSAGQIDIRSNTFGTGSSVAITLADAVWGTEVGLSNGTSTGAAFTASGTGVGKYLESPVNGGGYLNVIDGVSDLAVNDRVLVSMEGGNDVTPNLNNGIYYVSVLGDASHKFKLVRATDCDQASTTEFHKGTYSFITEGTAYTNTGWDCITNIITVDTTANQWSQFSGAPGLTYDQGLIQIVNSVQIELDTAAAAQSAGAAGGSSGLEFDTDAPAGKLRAKVDPVKGISRNANGLGLLLNGTTLEFEGTNPTLGLRVKGLPLQFEINSSGVSANVTAANLTALTGGGATTLHSHAAAPATKAQKVELDMDATGGSVTIGDPVYVAGANLIARGDTTDAKSKIVGVARTNPGAGNMTPIVVAGVCDSILTTASAGVPYYLKTGGGLDTALPGAAKRVIQCGMAWNATDLFVRIVDFGKKAA